MRPKLQEVNLLNTLTRLTYRKEVLNVARWLRLTRPLRKLYHRCVISPDGLYRAGVLGHTCLYQVDSPQVMRNLESEFVRETRFHEALASVLRPGDIFFDIGSNVGEFVIPIGKLVGPGGCVVAFEPQTLAHSRLQRNIALNELSNVRAFKSALGTDNKVGTLSIAGVSSPSLRVKENRRSPGDESFQERPTGSDRASGSGADSQDEEVQIYNGDWLRTNQSLGLPRAVKIDVEGYEGEVIRGLSETLSAPECVLMCCEIHPPLLPKGTDVQTIVNLAGEAGFDNKDVQVRPSARTTQVHLIARKTSHN